jgi:hypothetical protein
MADSPINSQKNSEVVTEKNGTTYRRTLAHLPAFYRTDANHKFLSSTLDPLIQPGKLERLDGYIGSKSSYSRKTSDHYVSATNNDRENYQLEPTVTYTDQDTSSINPEDQVKFTATYDDYINQLKYFGGDVSNHDRLNREKVYAWHPAIDFDKLINYREYYWLPEGPNPITVSSVGSTAVTEINVSHAIANAYTFSNHNNSQNPTLTLYRGNTYKFNVDSHGHPLYIMTQPFSSGVDVDGSTSILYNDGVSGNGTEVGTLTFTVPTDAPNVLYYQCSSHSVMQGTIKIQTITEKTNINPETDIVGTVNYKTSSGVQLTNGIKIKFLSNVTDSVLIPYKNKEFYVEGVGKAITLSDTASLLPTGSYSKETTELYDEVPYAERPYAVSFFRAEDPDYITIKRNAVDGNAWSRYNRWFHKETINATATALGHTPNLVESDRAKRPIIEFDGGLALYEHGSVQKKAVTLVDTVTKDVFSEMVNKTGYIVDGIKVANGMRILITADTDPLINNKIYKINFVTVQGQQVTTLQLTEDSDTNPVEGESVTVEYGAAHQGKSYYYNSGKKEWVTGQNKTQLNQAPLFDLFDSNHTSFSDSVTYPNSSFNGAKVFSYQISDTATTDTVLGLKVKYKTINNVGDMLFENDYSTGSFEYTLGNNLYTKKYNAGHLHIYTKNNKHISRDNFIEQTSESKQHVIRTFIVTSDELYLFPVDFFKNSKDLTDLEVAVEVNSVIKSVNIDYTIVNGVTHAFIKFNKDLKVNDIVKLTCYSSAKKIPGKGLYKIPENLAINSLNAQLSNFTYGEILNHLNDIVLKNKEVIGSSTGSNNIRDLPDVRYKGGKIIQHSMPLPQAFFLLIDKDANIMSSIDYSSTQYQLFKDSFINFSSDKSYDSNTSEKVDEIIANFARDKTSSFPFFYEDMVGYGENASVRTYTVQDSSIVDYAIDSQFDMKKVSNRAINVYLNDNLLIYGHDYSFSNDDDSVTIKASLLINDKIVIKDYRDTTGSFIPPTPTKLGMYAKFKPEIINDNTYRTTQRVIIGHDGSKTKAYGDYRDDLLLELEKRIYNNCKTAFDSTLLSESEVVPSVSKKTDYTLEEINKTLSYDFYSWAGRNNIDFRKNTTYNADDQFTWNYSASKSTIDNKLLPGYWRAIFKYYYDTDRPHTHPWEMFGYSERPSWWEENYGPAPYSAGNDLLWNDVARGFDRGLGKTVPRYIKANIKSYLPVDVNGSIKSPIQIGFVFDYESNKFNQTWKFGDNSPTENAWRTSSQYPFSVLKMLALTRPAKFFGYYIDNSTLSTNIANNIIDTRTGIRPALKTLKYHLETETNSATGTVTRYQTAGYQPFIVNYLIKNSLDPVESFYKKIKNLNVQLGYKLGGFTDKDNLKILTDSISPGSTSGSQLIPHENYKILFRTSNPVEIYDYSGVLIELNSAVAQDGSTLEGGYKVVGYNTLRPFFKYFEPSKNGSSKKITVGDTSAVVYENVQTIETVIPYGTVFENIQEVVNFLSGYGKYLEKQGFTFDMFSKELKETANWDLSIKEFVYWSKQNWVPGSAITVSPGADSFSLETNNTVVGKLTNVQGEYTVLDSSGKKLSSASISTKRIGSTFEIRSKETNTGIFNVVMTGVQKEHIVLFDNTTVFSDTIFDLATGFRQERLKLIGWKTGNWNGDYYSPGFVFDQAIVNKWTANTDYQIGDTVEYNAGFYTAKSNHNSEDKFNQDRWTKKAEKPAPQLIPNFDYKISQFNDFYDLESSNFDEGQQKLAQHLTGYQSRPYLENLFSNDISQFKFYQGFIREKGTLNSINRLVKGRFSGDEIKLDVSPEWMIKVGELGNLDGENTVQFKLPASDFKTNNQSIELVGTESDQTSWNNSMKVIQTDLYSSPLEYTALDTFHEYDYSTSTVDRDTPQVLKTAGYVRFDDVQHTAFNESSLLDLDIQKISSRDRIWIAKKENTDWDVYRVTYANLEVQQLTTVDSDTKIQLTFNDVHSFIKGDYFAIRNSLYDSLNGVYKVNYVIDSRTLVFELATAGAFAVSAGAQDSTVVTYGNIYKFISVRHSSMDNVNSKLSYREYTDQDTLNERSGDRVFIDNEGSTWKIYEKINPYDTTQLNSPSSMDDQDFGFKIVGRADGRTLCVSAPKLSQGTVNFFSRKSADKSNAFTLISSNTTLEGDDGTTRLGQSLSISSDENFIIAGAPFANIVAADGSSRHNDAGLIKIYEYDKDNRKYEEKHTITANVPGDGSTVPDGYEFGTAHALAEPTENSELRDNPKYLFVSAPGYNNNTGIVYYYTLGTGDDGSTYNTWTLAGTISSNGNDGSTNKSEDRFGTNIQTNDNGNIIAISSTAPGEAGTVEIFTRSEDTFTHRHTLVGVLADGSTKDIQFGKDISMSTDGKTLVISAPGFDNNTQNNAGAVYVYKWMVDGSTSEYSLDQTIYSPETDSNMQFGSSLKLNKQASRLLIGAENYTNKTKNDIDFDATTFDLGDTTISEYYAQSGAAYTATIYNSKFVIDDKIESSGLSENDQFGKGLELIDNTVYVGAPLDDVSGQTNNGSVSVFDTKTDNVYAWKVIAEESNFIDDRKIKKAFIFDSNKKQIVDTLNYFDPVKGKIFGVADREISYKTEWDPAVYNVGTEATTVNSSLAWGEEHIGEVWWDLSTVKWVWYEQGTTEYKTKNWGKTFPGSSIDVYEWVESRITPLQWQNITSGTSGASQKISGQPKHSDNTVYTVKQKYNTLKDRFDDYYYYWVKNSIFLPAENKSVVKRQNNTFYIANILENPQASRIKYFGITSKNSLILFNVKDSLVNNDLVASISYKTNLNVSETHSVWKLLKEGDKNERPSLKIEKKWWDSLVGVDSHGNQVPDPDLPLNEQYGTNIRPRQSWYINRYNAVQEIIQYTNLVLKKYQIANDIQYTNLNSEEPEPSRESLLWDTAVDTYNELTYINVNDISGTTNVLVKADNENSDGLWAIYNWNGSEWSRTRVQTYKTNRYYNFVDWYKTDGDMKHSAETVIDKQIKHPYELEGLILDVGKHVKVTNSDTGGWKLYMKTASDWENVGTENGTIQFKSSLYDYSIDATGFAGNDNFDENVFDKEPTNELRKILTALRDDIFINEYAIEYNNIFFIGLRKVLQEQAYVEWLAKTSFINVTNTLRPLDQRRTYQSNTETYVEQYINEIKPYHTKIREYKLGYTNLENQDSINTDFDLPAFYDGTNIRNIDIINDTAKMQTYPYKFWLDNYKNTVASIDVTNSGSGYITAPTVTLVGGTTKSIGPFAVLGRANAGPSNGEYGYFYPLYTAKVDAELADRQNNSDGTSTLHRFSEYPTVEFYMPTSNQNNAQSSQPDAYIIYSATDVDQATARAKISGGKVSKIEVLSAGNNYTATPRVVITGGGTDNITPSNPAKAHVVLENKKVRGISTTVKFDRIKSSADVHNWKANTAHNVSDLLRYNNELYQVTTAYTTTSNFREGLGNLKKLRGDEGFITAAERTLGLYAPDNGMPGNALSQVMTGVDYGGVMVTGLAFDNDKGWDKSPWYEMPWDNFGLSRVKVFYGDATTTQFTFDVAPTTLDVYTIYFTDQSDSTKLANTNRIRQVSQVIRGDGSTRTFTITDDNGNPAGDEILIELIPFDDDGVLTPTDDKTLDSIVSGGLFGSAVGQSPSDIIVEGDAFVTPETSYAPEENVPGSIFDTVDIKVYTTPDSGAPFVKTSTYFSDGSTTTFDIGQTPGTQNSVIVTQNGSTLKLTTDYSVDVANKTITLVTVPVIGDKISIKSFAVSGRNYMITNDFIGDGSTNSFTTDSEETYQLDSSESQFFITVDGLPTTHYTTTTFNRKVIVSFHNGDGSTANPPASGKLIQISSFNIPSGTSKAYNEIRTENLTYDGSTLRYNLTYPSGSVSPYTGLTLIEVDGKILRGPDNAYYLGDGSTETFSYRGYAGGAIASTGSAYVDTKTGEKTDIINGAVSSTTIDAMLSSTYNSVWYLAVTQDETANEYATAKYSIVHNGVDAYATTSSITKSGSVEHITVDAKINGSNLAIEASGVSNLNSVSWYRIGLGNNTSSGVITNYSKKIITSVTGSTVETIDTFNKNDFTGAKYFIAVKNSSTGEYNSLEAMIVHNGSDAFVSQYNVVNTGSSDILILDADVSGTDVRLRAYTNQPNTTLTMYRIALSDTAITDGENVLSPVTVASSSGVINSFNITDYVGAHYIITSHNTDSNLSSIQEVTVITDGTQAYLTHGPKQSTNLTDQLNFSVVHSGNTIRLSASSNSGENTVVSMYRIGLLREAAGAKINPDKIRVYVNNVKKNIFSDYTVNASTESIAFKTPPSANDVVAVSTLSGNHYYSDGADIIIDPTEITNNGISLTQGSILSVTTFNNALGSKQRRELFAGNDTGFNKFLLDGTPPSSDYVFVWKNGEALINNLDYKLKDNEVIIRDLSILKDDRVDVMYFESDLAIGSVGYRIFKDMLNRTFYKRISQKHTTKLTTALLSTDKTISVENADVLNPVDGTSLEPGVIFIDKERIEYFTKTGNTLGQLRRGTLGTGMKDHASGERVVDASAQQTVPYADTNYIKTYLGNGSQTAFLSYNAVSSPSEVDVFVGGKRLLHLNDDSSSNYSVSTWDGSSGNIVLTQVPADRVQVKIIQKKGKVWSAPGVGTASDGKGLQNTTTEQGKFIAGEATNAPE